MNHPDLYRTWMVLLLAAMGQAIQAQPPMSPDTLSRTESLLRSQLLTAPPPPLGIFCRLDVELDRRLPVPVRFRLGDARAVERWEGHGPGDPRLLR